MGRSQWRRADLWILLALAVSVFAIYLQVWNFAFVSYDDPEFVGNNIFIRNGLTLAAVKWAFSTNYAANWFPLTWLSYMVGVSLYGVNSGWHHLTNVLIHATTTLLLFVVMRQMTGARWRSAFVAALFAVHPLHVEPVAWVAERKEVLGGLFWVLSIGAYLFYIRQPRIRSYLLLVVLFCCGLMSKPMIVTLPITLLLLDFWPLRRSRTTSLSRLILEKVPLLVLSAAASVVTVLVQQGAGAVSSLGEVPFKFRIENALVSYFAYLFQFFWPAGLAVVYPYQQDLPVWQVIGVVAALAAITAFAILERNHRPYVAVGWFWFTGTLVPVIGLVQVGVQARADRYMYIPLIGLSIIVAWGVGEIADRSSNLRWAVAALAIASCCAYALVAWSIAPYWRNSTALFRRAIDVTQDNWFALNALSLAYLSQDRLDDALPYVTQTLKLRPNLADARINFGTILSKRGDFDGAATQFRTALQLAPDNPDAEEGLAVALTEKGQIDQALANFKAALKIRPDDPAAHYNLGRLYGFSGQPSLALAEFAEAVRLQPANVAAHLNLGTTYAAQGRLDEACGQFREALRLKPDYTAAHFDLASTLANMGRFDEAISHFQEVLQVQPDFPGARQALEKCLELKRESAR